VVAACATSNGPVHAAQDQRPPVRVDEVRPDDMEAARSGRPGMAGRRYRRRDGQHEKRAPDPHPSERSRTFGERNHPVRGLCSTA